MSSNSVVILELSATSTEEELREHFDRAISYGRNFSARLVKDMWMVHFTCMDGATLSPIWPTSNQQELGLNVVHFWHDLQFTTIRMSARWLDESGNVVSVDDEEVWRYQP
jgi:hypothetical protein